MKPDFYVCDSDDFPSDSVRVKIEQKVGLRSQDLTRVKTKR